MSLFQQLLRLHKGNRPTEDFLTEVFAHCLTVEDGLMKDFLKEFKIAKEFGAIYHIKTQITFSALADHEMDSQPDMVLSYSNHTIFFENKVGSKEGYKQLSRYTDHLNTFSGNKILVYITKHFDPKKRKDIFKKGQEKIKFIPIRWYEIARFFEKYNRNLIIKEFLQFMKTINISSDTRFSPLDISTMQYFSRVKSLMDNVLFGQVASEFKKQIGGNKQEIANMTQFKNHERYFIHKFFHGDLIWVGLGFSTNDSHHSDYPILEFNISINPKYSKRESLIETLKSVVGKGIGDTKWKEYQLDSIDEWAGIYLVKSLKEFLNNDNHVESVKRYFLDCIKEYSEIKPSLLAHL